MAKLKAKPKSGTSGFDGLRLIALLRFGKALLLLATAYGIYKLLNPALVARLYIWTQTLTDSNERRLILRALTWFSGVGIAKIEVTVGVTAAYTVLLVVEGTGLWLRKAWAEWITVISTSSLIPFEVWELVMRPPAKKPAVLAAFLLNVVIVVYLIRQLRSAVKRRGAK